MAPRPEEVVGLTIAGLNALRVRHSSAGDFADALAAAIGVMASWERSLEPDPQQPVKLAVQLDTHLAQWLNVGTSDMTAEIYGAGALDVLQREYAPISVDRAGEGLGSVTLRMFLAPYLAVRTSRDYLD